MTKKDTCKGIKWGYLREKRDQAIGNDKDTGLPRTCLEDYLRVIFPDVVDWVNDMQIPGFPTRSRTDFRSEKLKLIIEVDDPVHYQTPYNIDKDNKTTKLYESYGYKVVRIPYFIQLSNEAVNTLFGVEVNEPLFDESYPSMGINGNNSPACLCHAGIERMAKEFVNFPRQYKVNIDYLLSLNDDYHTGVSLLINEYNKL